MGNLLKQLSKHGFTDDIIKSKIINIAKKQFKHETDEWVIHTLTAIKTDPTAFLQDERLAVLASLFNEETTVTVSEKFTLRPRPETFEYFGQNLIDEAAVHQMRKVMQLPVVDFGALMPDAHAGYGLPIGGVIATKNVVIPYAVGVDIGCRMALTIIDAPTSFLKAQAYKIEKAIKNNTHFGIEGSLAVKQWHPVLDDDRFKSSDLLKKLQGKAARQLGSSGTGNHFVEFGEVILDDNNGFGIKAGKYVGLLSHSGSRGLGAKIAEYFTRQAVSVCQLPREVSQLAWLNMDSDIGADYWQSMQLAGDYAEACHEQIHKNLMTALGLKAITHIANHHNFAWKEYINGEEYIVHRKGATPAAKGIYGIIPGSMTSPAFIVSGKGNESSINSASHGAGRYMSRNKAKLNITNSALKKQVLNEGVTLIGGSVEESPDVYKNIHKVMNAQSDLVNIEGTFNPKIVRMYKE